MGFDRTAAIEETLAKSGLSISKDVIKVVDSMGEWAYPPSEIAKALSTILADYKIDLGNCDIVPVDGAIEFRSKDGAVMYRLVKGTLK